MSDKKISELTALTAPDGAEELVVNDSGTSKKITQANLLKGIDNSSADATAITIDASENVGIGTSSPDANLDVKDSSGGVIRVGTDTDNIGTDTAFGTLEFFNGDTSNSGPAVTAMIEAKTHPTNAYSTGGDIVFSNRSYPSSSLIEKVRFPSDGGITFNGDTAAANALDDYEEGTWTPSISFDGGTTGITYYTTYNKGWYTKVGNVVTVEMSLVLSSKGTSTGQLRVNMPFVSTSGTASVGASVGTHLVNATAPLLYGDFTLGYMVLKSQVASTTVGFSTVTNTECGGAFNLIGNFSYTI